MTVKTDALVKTELKEECSNYWGVMLEYVYTNTFPFVIIAYYMFEWVLTEGSMPTFWNRTCTFQPTTGDGRSICLYFLNTVLVANALSACSI